MSGNRPIFVISDLHMGHGGSRDNFAQNDREQQLSSFLDYVQSERGGLIILGDLFEFWQFSISRVIMSNISFLDRFARLKAYYILGNHDADLLGFLDTSRGRKMLRHKFFKKMGGPLDKSIGGKKFRFMHGHEVDQYNRGDSPGLGRLLAIFAGIMEDKNMSPKLPSGETVENVLANAGEGLALLWRIIWSHIKGSLNNTDSANPERELTPAQNPDRLGEMMSLYRQDKEKEGYDIAIIGHTHKPGRYEGWYYNSGSWAGESNNFVKISPDGDVGVFNWKQGKAVEIDIDLAASPS